MTYRQRRALRAETLDRYSTNNATKARAELDAAHKAIEHIPPGQPILVGHHSERHHRRDLARHDSKMRRGLDLAARASDQSSRAATIAHQLDTSIYNDDPDAIEQLRAKLDRLEAQRNRIKDVNKAIRKVGYDVLVVASAQYVNLDLNPPLSADEIVDIASLIRHVPHHDVAKRGYPPYTSSNLTNSIVRIRARIKFLEGSPAAANPGGDTATARAGLVIVEGMTTPSRPGKQPRPVWTVSGNLGPHRAMLEKLDGRWYRGAFSFWDDPTDAIEQACSDRERASES